MRTNRSGATRGSRTCMQDFDLCLVSEFVIQFRVLIFVTELVLDNFSISHFPLFLTRKRKDLG